MANKKTQKIRQSDGYCKKNKKLYHLNLCNIIIHIFHNEINWEVLKKTFSLH